MFLEAPGRKQPFKRSPTGVLRSEGPEWLGSLWAEIGDFERADKTLKLAVPTGWARIKRWLLKPKEGGSGTEITPQELHATTKHDGKTTIDNENRKPSYDSDLER